MPPARFPSSDKIEQQNGKLYSSDIESGEIHEEDPPFIDKLAHFPYLAPASGILTTVSFPPSLSGSLPISVYDRFFT